MDYTQQVHEAEPVWSFKQKLFGFLIVVGLWGAWGWTFTINQSEENAPFFEVFQEVQAAMPLLNAFLTVSILLRFVLFRPPHSQNVSKTAINETENMIWEGMTACQRSTFKKKFFSGIAVCAVGLVTLVATLLGYSMDWYQSTDLLIWGLLFGFAALPLGSSIADSPVEDLRNQAIELAEKERVQPGLDLKVSRESKT